MSRVKLCLDAVDRYLERVERESGSIVVSGRPEAYPDAVALYIASQCSIKSPRLHIAYISVHDNPDFIYTLSRDVHIDLRAREASGLARVARAESIHDINDILAATPDDSIIIVDSTAGQPHDLTAELLEDLFNYVRQNRVQTKLFLLVNEHTWREPPFSLLEELADLFINLNVRRGERGLERTMEFKYFKGGLIPYIRVFYSIGPEGVEIAFREEV